MKLESRYQCPKNEFSYVHFVGAFSSLDVCAKHNFSSNLQVELSKLNEEVNQLKATVRFLDLGFGFDFYFAVFRTSPLFSHFFICQAEWLLGTSILISWLQSECLI